MTTADHFDRIAASLQRGITRGVRTIGVDLAHGESFTLHAYDNLEDLTDAQLEVAQELRRQRLEDAPPEVIHRRVDHLQVLNRRLQRARP